MVDSSADPAALSLTVKGALGTIGSILILISPIVHLNIGDQQVAAVTDLVTQVIIALAGAVSFVATALGLARKIYLTIQSWKTPPVA